MEVENESRRLTTILNSFGIVRNGDQDGEAIYSITLEREGLAREERVVFQSASKKWRLIRNAEPDVNKQGSPDLQPELQDSKVTLATRDLPVDAELGQQEALEDWTRLLPSSDHVDFLKSRDWAASPLGPMQSWPICLQLMVQKMLVDPRGACVYWCVPASLAIAFGNDN